MKYSVEELKTKKEDQTYDRKSARKDPKGLSDHITAFANADGGTSWHPTAKRLGMPNHRRNIYAKTNPLLSRKAAARK